MDLAPKKLVRLLLADRPAELRAAAVLVYGELGLKDGELAAQLVACLDDADPLVRLNAIRTAGQLKLVKALPTLLERIKGGGPEAQLAADSASKLGADAVKKLQAMIHQVVPGVRRYIAAALTSVSTGGGEVGVSVLLDTDPQVALAAAQAIIARLPTITPAEKAALAKDAIALASDKKKKLLDTAELPLVKLLAKLNDPSSAEVLWERTMPPHAAEVRALALATAGGWLSTPTKEQWKKLFACGVDRDFQVAAPALVLLSRLPVKEPQLPEWMALFDAPDAAARRLVIDKLGDRDDSAIAEGLLKQWKHHNKDLRESARTKLAALDEGRKVLVKALLEAESADEAWLLARTIAPFAKSFPAKLRSDILDRAAKAIEASDTRSDALIFLLREIDPTALRTQLLDRAVAKRKKKDYETSLDYLKLLARDPSVGFDVRLELAFVGLKLSPKNLSSEARQLDPCLRNFATALGQNAEGTTAELAKAKWLDVEDVFYVGFHFAEHFGQEREFGVAALKDVIARSPKSKLGTTAKNKIKSIGSKAN